jgi:NADPH-dependent 2,4-dienoyl-CoA reductase/sulfur reductase-like enzyme
MSGSSYRIPTDVQQRFGQRIDHAQPIGFSFNNQRLIGLAGDSLASGLLANGVSFTGSSSRLYRPRGIMSILGNNGDPPVTLGTASRRTPYSRLNNIRLSEGMHVRGGSAWRASAQHLFAGTAVNPWLLQIPRVPRAADPDSYEHVQMQCDVLIIGAGLAGLAAAEVAAREGLFVLIAEETPLAGGIADAYDGTVDGSPITSWLAERIRALTALPHVDLRVRTCAVRLFPDGKAQLVERVAGDNIEHGLKGAPRERLWNVHTKAVVVATGARERPLVFQDNDCPGIMLGCSARLLLRRYGVAAGRRIVVLTSSDEGHRTALDLKAAGATIERLVDLRLRPDGVFVHKAKAEALPLSFGSAPLRTSTIRGGRALEGVTIVNRLREDGPAVTHEVLCDAMIMSGGWQPNYHLAVQAGASMTLDPHTEQMHISPSSPHIFIAGAARAVFNAGAVLEDGWKAGESAVALVSQRIAARGKWRELLIEESVDHPAELSGKPLEGSPLDRAFIDFEHDVTAHEWLQKSTSLADYEVHKALTLPEEYVVPVRLGTLAGNKPPLEQPRSSVLADKQGGLAGQRGGWGIIECYPLKGESREQAIRRETKELYGKLGIMDACCEQVVSVAGKEAGLFLRALGAHHSDEPEDQPSSLLLNNDAPLATIMTVSGTRHMLGCCGNGVNLGVWLAEAQRCSGADVRITDESERWAKIIVWGDMAYRDNAIEGASSWRLHHYGIDAHLMLVPVEQGPVVWSHLRSLNAVPFGWATFERLQFDKGVLTTHQRLHLRRKNAHIIGLLAEHQELLLPPGTHIFNGERPLSRRTAKKRAVHLGSVIASSFSVARGRNFTLAAIYGDVGEKVHFSTQGQIEEAQVVIP